MKVTVSAFIINVLAMPLRIMAKLEARSILVQIIAPL